MDWDIKDVPLSQSNVSLKLSEIQQRCADLLQEPDSLDELSLADEPAVVEPDCNDPYNHG